MSVTLHTSLGDIKIEVFCESVPKTSEVQAPFTAFPTQSHGFQLLTPHASHQNFLALCASGYYDQSPFHRLIPKFMVQTGAPANPTAENPKGGQSIWGAPFEDEIRPALRHGGRGFVSMANKGPGTNGSQFFITFDKAPHLDGLNTVFGKVIGDEGLVTLAKMEAVEVDKKSRPKEPFWIEKVTIHANPLAE
ncbi:peptidyl-prolyl cis-trans isomerase-like 3 [Trichoderma asperellum]